MEVKSPFEREFLCDQEKLESFFHDVKNLLLIIQANVELLFIRFGIKGEVLESLNKAALELLEDFDREDFDRGVTSYNECMNRYRGFLEELRLINLFLLDKFGDKCLERDDCKKIVESIKVGITKLFKLDLGKDSIEKLTLKNIDNLIKFLKNFVELKGIEFRVDLDISEDLLPKITVSNCFFNKLLLELVKNAYEKLENTNMQAGKIEVKIYEERIKENLFLKVEVKDNGPKILLDDSLKIFDFGYTTKSSEISGQRGKGLFFIKKQLIEREGNIFLKEVEEGVCFEVFIQADKSVETFFADEEKTLKKRVEDVLTEV